MKKTTLTKNSAGFTLVEIMIVVAIIALLATIAVPSFLRARKRSQATKLVNDARILEGAIDQWAIEKNESEGTEAVWADLEPYVKKTSLLRQNGGLDIFGAAYVDEAGDATLNVGDQVTVSKGSYDTVKDVTDEKFWGAYGPTY